MADHYWILSVATDIEEYAKRNGLKSTSECANIFRNAVEKELLDIEDEAITSRTLKDRNFTLIDGGIEKFI